jgi:hypothetical protein
MPKSPRQVKKPQNHAPQDATVPKTGRKELENGIISDSTKNNFFLQKMLNISA